MCTVITYLPCVCPPQLQVGIHNGGPKKQVECECFILNIDKHSLLRKNQRNTEEKRLDKMSCEKRLDGKVFKKVWKHLEKLLEEKRLKKRLEIS